MSAVVPPQSSGPPGPEDPGPDPTARAAHSELDVAWAGRSVVAIVPCHNEAGAVDKVVQDLKAHVPGIRVYVYDNLSTDETVDVARRAGALVRHEQIKGKGNVVRRAFADLDADIYLMIDGDDTYDAAAAPMMIETLVDGHYDHVLGVRDEVTDGTAYRAGHEWGNRLLNRVVKAIFGTDPVDMLSGYRVFSQRFVKSFPAISREFEIETELTVHALSLRTPQVTVPVGFKERAPGTESKLRTYRDGSRILKLILNLTRHERPVAFYGTVALVAGLVGLGLGTPAIADYFQDGNVPRMPSLVAAIACVVVACVAMTAGLVLDGMRKNRHELSRLTYLRYPSV